MFKYSKNSLQKLSQCDYRLQCLAHLMLYKSEFDITVTCGHRSREEQEDSFKKGFSKARFGQSKHNSLPSLAVDLAPYPINWDASDIRWDQLGKLGKDCAKILGISVKWGGDFKNIVDKPHFELE